MRAAPFLFTVLGATLISAGSVVAHAAEGVYYDPTNKASPTGYTTDYDDFRTIGCPGKQMLDAPCKVPDSDKDGVLDDKDKCPNTPAGRKVNASGCEMDTDTDGIVDSLDKCPTIYAKTADGCPAPVVEPAPVAPPKKLVLGDVLFDTNEATLTADSVETLDKAAESLKEWGDVKVEVAGYTDSRGTDEYNQNLSVRRADAVRTYLIGKGIAADRLTAKGYGESNPVADNDTDEGRSENRRVELVPMK
jgi:outer membrane protein OmpA-like peptidoglycan-associated protein